MKTLSMVGSGDRPEGFQFRFVYYALLPLLLAAEGIRRLVLRLAASEEEAPARGAWFLDASSQAYIATSYTLMARSMLQSSERRCRPARLS